MGLARMEREPFDRIELAIIAASANHPPESARYSQPPLPVVRCSHLYLLTESNVARVNVNQ